MSSPAPAPAVPQKKPNRLRRLWLPALAVVIALGAVGFNALAPEGGDPGPRNFMAVLGVAVGLLLFSIWFAFLSGLAGFLRIGYLLLLAAAVVSVRIDFTGDVKPSKFSIWWLDSQERVLRAQRAAQAKLAAPPPLASLAPTDMPAFRGVNRDGVVVGPALNADWKANPPKQLWRQPAGGGYAGFTAVGPLLFTIEQRGDKETVACYDPDTGVERWSYEHPAHFKEALGGPGPRATPTYFAGCVYSLGAAGHLACLDAATGKPKWTRDILEGNDNVQWGMSGSPLVYDDVVVVNPGAQNEASKGKALVAFDRETGKQKWTAGSTRAGYSSPMLATLGDVRQILLLDGEGLGGYDAATGKRLWWFAFPTYQGINVAQPLVLAGDRVFISAGYGVGCVMLKAERSGDSWTVKEVWRNKNLKCKFTSPILHEGHIYGLDDGILACLEADSGMQRWKGGRYGHGQILLAGSLIFVQCEDGNLALVNATPTAHQERAKLRVFDRSKNWNTPLLFGGRAFVRNHEEMAAFDLRVGPGTQGDAAAPAATGSGPKSQ